MTNRLAALVVALAIGSPTLAHAMIPDPKFASVAPTRALADARAATEIRQRDDGAAARIAELEATIARMEEAARREARIRDLGVQARFEQTDRKIREVVGRLQVFVGCLILLLVALFVWVSDLARRETRTEARTATRESVAVTPRSSRLG